jgi:hypothetical protein
MNKKPERDEEWPSRDNDREERGVVTEGRCRCTAIDEGLVLIWHVAHFAHLSLDFPALAASLFFFSSSLHPQISSASSKNSTLLARISVSAA